MRGADGLRLAGGAITAAPGRSLLTIAAMALGVAAVILLTALGEGARRYVVDQFASLGTHLLIVLPGRSETGGAGVALAGLGSARNLTLDDARALQRHPQVRRVAPIVAGSAAVAALGRERDSPIMGSTAELLELRHWTLAQGRFLPPGDWDRARPVVILGTRLRDELFAGEPALGQWLRIADRRYRVIGVLASEGRSIGIDVQDIAIIPAASAQALFNTPSLLRILVEARQREALPGVQAFILKTLRARHQGEEDITVITQDAVLSTFDRILRSLTFTVAGVAAISLAVAGILVMNIMLVAVSARAPEIGLLKALGAQPRQILALFLTEAGLLALSGAALGAALGSAAAWALRLAYPTLPTAAPAWALVAAVTIALVTGLLFGWLPARRATRLDPIAALARR